VAIGHPRTLTLIRHAQSAGNVANDAALAAGLPELDLAQRDMDVPLSELGEAQAEHLGEWFRGAPTPSAVLASPYRRAVDTAAIALGSAGLCPRVRLDERHRAREFGILDRLTKVGIEARHPEQAAARAFLGKFFHRPPGGESWADVASRVRDVYASLRMDHVDGHVVVVTHQAVITLFRYVLEELTEAELLALDKSEQVANTAVTTYRFDGGEAVAVVRNDSSHLPDAETTEASDLPVAPR
jgi:broad specificity phosphatase PhoE